MQEDTILDLAPLGIDLDRVVGHGVLRKVVDLVAGRVRVPALEYETDGIGEVLVRGNVGRLGAGIGGKADAVGHVLRLTNDAHADRRVVTRDQLAVAVHVDAILEDDVVHGAGVVELDGHRAVALMADTALIVKGRIGRLAFKPVQRHEVFLIGEVKV